MKRIITSAVAGLAALSIATLAVVPLAGARTDRQAAPAATTIQVKGGEFFFRLSKKTLARPGKVTFSFKNIGHVTHDFSILGKKTPLIQPGRTTRVVVTFKKKGKYVYKCTVSGHAAAGMKGSFTVK